ncbi:hypothetical protein DFH06DRAFT_1141681 [Mycena polygramma]|nr:hypothetical protein DFH06DRAFT_1141681 [Mycena polygramma]
MQQARPGSQEAVVFVRWIGRDRAEVLEASSSGQATSLPRGRLAGSTFGKRRSDQRHRVEVQLPNYEGLVLQLSASPMLAEKYTYDRIDLVRLAGLLVSGVLRIPILIHHFCTLFATILLVCVLQRNRHVAIASLALLWLFHATTEQSLFIALIMYRFKCSKHLVQWTLYFSAVQSFLFKFAFSIYLYVWWGLKLSAYHQKAIDVAFSVLFVVTLTALMITQGMDKKAAQCFYFIQPHLGY